MASNHGSFPFSATQATPLPAELYSKPKVPVSTSSGFSLPIRAPPTVDDSDFEFPISTNGQEYMYGSCSSVTSDSGFVSGDDEFETASDRPSLKDPDDETLQETSIVEEYVVSRPLVKDPHEEYGVSRPVVKDPDDENLEESSVDEDYLVSRPFLTDPDEYLGETAFVDVGVLAIRRPGVPIAMLSRDSDDDSVGTDDVDDDGFLGPVRVPGIALLGRAGSGIKVKVSDDQDESLFEQALGAAVVKCSGNSTVSSDSVEDKVADDAEEAKVNSFVANQDVFVCAVGEIQGLATKELKNRMDWSDSDAFIMDAATRIGTVIDSEEDRKVSNDGKIVAGWGDEEILKVDATSPVDMVSDCEEETEVLEGGEIIVSGIYKGPLADETNSRIVNCCVKDSVSTELIEDQVLDDAEEAKVLSFVAYETEFLSETRDVNNDVLHLVGEIQGLEKVEERISDLKNIGRLGDKDAFIVDTTSPVDMVSDCKVHMKVLEGGASIVSGSNKGPLVDETNERILATLEANVDAESDGRNKGDVFSGSIIHRGSDDEKSEGIKEQRIDLGVELHDVAEDNATEEGLHSGTNSQDTQSLGSTFDPELELRTEVEDEMVNDYSEEGSNSEDDSKGLTFGVEDEMANYNSEEGSYSEDDSKGLTLGVLDTTKLIMDDLEQSLTPTSTGETSQDLFNRIERHITVESDEEVDTDGESKGSELFDSTILAALLKAANADRSGGVVKPNGPRLFTGSELTARSGESEENPSEDEKKKLERIQSIRVKFLRLVQRLGQSSEDPIASQVLYRLVLAAGNPSSQLFSLESAKRMAMQHEAEGKNDLDFSLNILVLGKAGVGKSATINSVFGEKKAKIDAFEPATTSVKDFVGMVDGIKVRIFDTPGLKSSLMEQAINRKILLSIRKLMKECPPDIVLYVDRLDTQTRDLNDLPLLRSINSLLGSSIWKNTIITLTHAASNPPDGLSGSPLSFDLYVAQRSRIIQLLISQSVGDLCMVNPGLVSPVSLVENHPSCQTGENGQMMLPNGESWRPQLLLLCYSMKILSEANSVAKAQDLSDHRKIFGFRTGSPPLPYFLSSLLQSSPHPKLPSKQGGDNLELDTELGDFSYSDQEDEDQYDQLLSFKPLKRSQIENLPKEQREAYFEEYDYRVRLLRKKHLREEVKRLQELKKGGKDEGDRDDETGIPSTVAVPLPDMVLPLSFDGGNPGYRYRLLEPTSQLLTRPVLYLHGWDHDCGYDGVVLESNLAIAGCLPAAISVQLNKDKKDFNVNLDSSVSSKHGENGSTMVGLDVQTIGKQLAYILKGETKFKNFKTNKTAAGVSAIFLGENVITGAKIEDWNSVGKNLVIVGSTGAMRSQGDTAYGANLELRLRERDFPIGQDQTTVSLSLMRWRGDFVGGCNLQSQFSIGRSSKMVVKAGINSKLSGQVSVRTSSSEQLQIALLGILPIANAMFKIFPGSGDKCLMQ